MNDSRGNTQHRIRLILGALGLSVILLGALFLFLTAPVTTHANGTSIRYVAPTGTDSGNNCLLSSNPCATIQHAVDVASPNDEIRVAQGTYSDLHQRAGITQIVYLTKTVYLRGSFAITDWATQSLTDTPSYIFPFYQGRGIVIIGTITPTIEQFWIGTGNASGLDGASGTDAGGGMYIVGATPLITGNRFENNVATFGGFGQGGGAYVEASNATFINNQFLDNIATVATPGFGIGGGLAAITSALILRENTFQNNTASLDFGFGGGIGVNSSLVLLADNVFDANSASFGAAGVGGGVYLAQSYGQLERNAIISNTATFSVTSSAIGGGLYLAAGNYDLVNNVIAANQTAASTSIIISNPLLPLAKLPAQEDIAQQASAILQQKLEDARASRNARSLQSIEALNAVPQMPSILVTPAPLSANLGDGMFIEGNIQSNASTNVRMRHTTIADNGDVGIAVAPITRLAMTNTILAGHTIGISTTAGSLITVTADHTLWYPFYVVWDAGTTITTTNDITGWPDFLNPPADYHIGAASDAIDNAIDIGVSDDYDGEARPQGLGPDIGADETIGTGEVGGWVFIDTSGDGHRNPYAPDYETSGISGVTIQLKQGGTIVSTVTSVSPSGWYKFLNVLPGSYTVEEQQPAGYASTSPNSVPVTVVPNRLHIVDFGEQRFTPTPTATPTPTNTPTPTPSPTPTSTPTPTNTPTPTPTATATSTPTPYRIWLPSILKQWAQP